MATTSNKTSNTSRTKAKNTPSLKSQGAGYSTTNSKGVTTFYKSAKDAPGYSDTADGKGVKTSAGKPISRVDAQGQVITSDKINQPPLTIPSPPKVDPLTGKLDMNNASLGAYDATTKQFTQNTGTPGTADNSFNYFKDLLGANATAEANKTSNVDILKESQNLYKKQQNTVNTLQTQLNTITSSRDQQMLSLEGQGRGQTGAFVGGEQARIEREAAIKAMPVQAQLAAAQDDLDSARSFASQYFQARTQDAIAQYNYQKELNSNIYNFLNASEQRRLAQVEKEQDRAFQVEQSNRQNLKQLAMQAVEYGQPALAGEFMGYDPASPTYDQDVADGLSRLRKPVAPTAGFSNQMSDNERALMSQFRGEQIVKDYNEILGQKGTIDAYIQNGVGGPADLALVFSFMKGLDPSSVVRESEYETAAKSGNIFQGAFAKFNGYFKEKGGFLPDNVRGEFQNLVNQKLAVKESQYKNVASQYNDIAQRQGLNPQNVVIDYGKGVYTPPTPITSSATTETPITRGFWGTIGNFLWGND